MKEKAPLGYQTNLDHWQVAQRFAVQNLTLPPSMPVTKVLSMSITSGSDLEKLVNCEMWDS